MTQPTLQETFKILRDLMDDGWHYESDWSVVQDAKDILARYDKAVEENQAITQPAADFEKFHEDLKSVLSDTDVHVSDIYEVSVPLGPPTLQEAIILIESMRDVISEALPSHKGHLIYWPLHYAKMSAIEFILRATTTCTEANS